ncbi:MAG: 23S rRNA (adenine(2030)-N(6))-methyltransferase RlmJ [Proteobacteria bacterium]|nr:23S rRNA (adenine(2030)-N(6))-methyltransferase RlmJ [Pseudomonadota bacterium]MDE3207861.1 23S rRNA (adenine(2030)-N(6))-methyltransferase RlmJ [Pseudomonadota bacterium]
MLSYRHAFHAGNHADVLKHVILVALLRHLRIKDKPFVFIDTHAGAGQYNLHEGYAQKNQEFHSGISRLLKCTDLPALLQEYVTLVRNINPDGELKCYPGSPVLARKMMRSQDRMCLFELHPGDHRHLRLNMQHTHLAKVEQANGFSSLKSHLPPVERRGLVLIDPSYEDKTDYQQVKNALQDGLKRFKTGIYAIWYPMLNRPEARHLPIHLKACPLPWINVTLQVARPQEDGFGMTRSGLFVLHPPWTLKQELETALPILTQLLAQDSTAGFTLETNEDQ